MRGSGEQRGQAEASRTRAAVRPGALTELLLEIARPEEAAGGPGDPLGRSEEPGLRGPSPGDRVGRFEIVREIGRGGFGTVYEARDPELGRAVALKLLRRAGPKELKADRMLAEAEAAARLAHPNIVHLYDLGNCEHGPFLVMELLRGTTLAERLRGGKLPPREALRVTVEAAKGVAHAHGQGVVHRDLKPGNVFVCEDGQVKLLDFGLAQVFGRPALAGGTPAYMAPEQARGEAGEERSDVYSLGVLLFELLAGRLPYEGDRERGVPAGGTAPEIPGAPAELQRIVDRMLARQPALRPANGREAHEALAAFQRTLEPRRRAWVAWSVAALGLAAAVGVAIRPALPRGRLAVVLADAANASDRSELDGAALLLAQALEGSTRLSIVPRARLVGLLRAEGPAPARIDGPAAGRAALAAHADAVVTLAIRGGTAGYELEARARQLGRDRDLFTRRERADAAGGLLEALDRLTDGIRLGFGEDRAGEEPPVRLARALSPEPAALGHYLEGRRLESEGLGREATAAYFRAVEADPDFPLPRVALASLAEFRDRDAMEEQIEAALRHPERVPPLEQRMIEAAAATMRWDHARALERYDEIISRWPDDPEAYRRAGELASERYGDAALARPYLERLLTFRALDPDAEVRALERLGRLDEALARARQDAAERPSRRSLALLSWIHRIRGEPREGLEAARAALGHGRGPPGEALFWSFVEADAVDEAAAAFERAGVRSHWVLGIQGRRREMLAAFDARTPPPTAPLWLRGLHHNMRADLLAGDGDAAGVWREVEEQLRLGCAAAACGDSALAATGDREHASRIDQLFPMVERRSPCRRLTRALLAWRDGDRDRALDELAGMEFGGAAALRGEILLDAGRPREAVEEFRRFRRFPNRFDGTESALLEYPRSLHLEAVALERLGDRDGARKVLGRLLRLWERADSDQPLLAQARALVIRLGKGDDRARR